MQPWKVLAEPKLQKDIQLFPGQMLRSSLRRYCSFSRHIFFVMCIHFVHFRVEIYLHFLLGLFISYPMSLWHQAGRNKNCHHAQEHCSVNSHFQNLFGWCCLVPVWLNYDMPPQRCFSLHRTIGTPCHRMQCWQLVL